MTFSAGKLPSGFLTLLGLIALGAGLSGCASSDAPRATKERVIPPMPTMGPSTTVVVPPVPESEIVARALRAALAGDLAAARKTLDLAAAPPARVGATMQLVTALARQNPLAAATLALELPPGPNRSSANAIAARALVERSPDEALRWALDLPESASASEARRAVAENLIAENPRAMLDRIHTIPATPVRDDLLASAGAVWARKDTAAAIAWLREQPADDLRARMTTSMAFEIARTKPHQAIALAESLPLERNRWVIFSAIAETWVAIDRDGAFRWAADLPKGEAQEAALAGINTGLGVGSTRRTSRPDAGGIYRSRGGRAAYAVSEPNDPPAFATWLATQSLTMTREEAILEYIRQRGSQDMGAIGTWIANLAGEPTRQRAQEIYLEEALRASPANAASWLNSLAGSERKDEMIEKTARRWLQTDPAAAAAWLRQSNLPTFRQEELLRQAVP